MMRTLLSFGLLPLFLLACSGGTKTDDTGDTADTADSGDTSDTSDTGTPGNDFCAVRDLFEAECVSCHSAANPQGDLDLQTDAYAAIVGVASPAYAGRTLVVAGDPDTSFLYLKMINGQDASEGEVMPPAGQLPASDTETVRAWIAKGASSECGTTDTGASRHHPVGFDDPAQHGMAAKYQEETCVECHGADLTGGDVGVSCDTCHEANWRTDCTYCHGGTDNATGAPPVDIDNQTTSLSFPEHTVHVERTIHAEWGCEQCHATPTDVLSSGHLFLGDTTPGVAELDFSGGQADRGTYAGSGSCSNVYCHGTGQPGSTGSPHSGDTETCHMCHGDSTSSRGMSGNHSDHIEERIECEECHPDVVSGNSTIIDPDKHVNTEIDMRLPSGMTWSGGDCTGTCHGERHDGRHW